MRGLPDEEMDELGCAWLRGEIGGLRHARSKADKAKPRRAQACSAIGNSGCAKSRVNSGRPEQPSPNGSGAAPGADHWTA